MCGIAGLISLDADSTIRSDVLHRVNSALRHRGPDDEGYLLATTTCGTVEQLQGDDTRVAAGAVRTRHIRDASGHNANVGLAHRRLSILDPSPAGHQPMSSPDGRHHLVYNGEVYNFVELRDQLRREGWDFQSGSDTEVVLAALATWGSRALTRMIGMFALAWLDTAEQRLLLARDVFGIKPLHYTQANSQFGFASEPAALLKLSGVGRRLDPHAAYVYLRHSITDHDDRTFFESIRQLPPAHHLSIDLNRNEVGSPTRYWRADAVNGSVISYSDAVEQLREQFLDSVRLHLRSDVPVAVMLSGGIDSSCVTMSARRALGDDAPLGAFSYIASEPRADESRWMQMVVDAAKLQFHEVRPSTDQLTEELDRVIKIQQAPFGSLSILAQHCVFRAVGQSGVKVILSGQGADELLGGYTPFAAARLASMMRRGRLLAASRFYARGSREWPGRKRMTIGLAQQLLPLAVQKQIRQFSGRAAAPDWLDAQWFQQRGVMMQSPRDARDRTSDSLKIALRDSLTRTGLPELLRYEDRNSMAWSVESRVPFLTTPLVEFLLSLPEQYIISDDCVSKASLRDAMRGIVPDPILDRRDKIAFSAPLRQWFSTLRPWIDECFQDDTLERLGLFRGPQIREHWSRVESGAAPPDKTLWRWVNLVRWAQIYNVEAA